MEKTSKEREFFKNFINRMLEEASFEEIKTVYFLSKNRKKMEKNYGR